MESFAKKRRGGTSPRAGLWNQKRSEGDRLITVPAFGIGGDDDGRLRRTVVGGLTIRPEKGHESLFKA